MDKLYRIKGGKLYEVFRISEDTSTTVTNDGSNNLGNALNKSYNSASPQQRGGTFSVDSKEFDGNDSNNATEVNINAKNPNDANTQIQRSRQKLGAGKDIRYNVQYQNA